MPQFTYTIKIFIFVLLLLLLFSISNKIYWNRFEPFGSCLNFLLACSRHMLHSYSIYFMSYVHCLSLKSLKTRHQTLGALCSFITLNYVLCFLPLEECLWEFSSGTLPLYYTLHGDTSFLRLVDVLWPLELVNQATFQSTSRRDLVWGLKGSKKVQKGLKPLKYYLFQKGPQKISHKRSLFHLDLPFTTQRFIWRSICHLPCQTLINLSTKWMMLALSKECHKGILLLIFCIYIERNLI